jgi:hypothetical protein
MLGTKAATGVRRGCGSRKKGGVYAESALVPGGSPLDFFIVDAPQPYGKAKAVGVDLVEIDGVVHILDRVGSRYYPEPSDIIEEGRAFGFSRRIPHNLEVDRLSPKSRILLVHERGLVANPAEFRQGVREEDDDPLRVRCALYVRTSYLARMSTHPESEADLSHFAYSDVGGLEECNRDWYSVAAPTAAIVTDGNVRREVDPDDLSDLDASDGASVLYVRQATPENSYRVFPRLEDSPDPEFREAIVASLPITNISVIASDDGVHVERFEAIKSKTSLPVHVSAP